MAEDNGGIMRTGSPQFKEFQASGSGGGFFSKMSDRMWQVGSEERAHARNIELGIIGHVLNKDAAEQEQGHKIQTMREQGGQERRTMSHKTKQTKSLFPEGFTGKVTHEQGDTRITGTTKYSPKPRSSSAKPASAKTTGKSTPKPAAPKTPAKPAAKPAASPKPRTPRGAK